ncbi:hypothetical protein FN846DRAFT_1021732 [Sphaerosporella brunnea]|uniref:Uncharacterized protein n=1 Tax=Sphaerosporella brunnea TaxID=1250544 RepID=A0A5J5EVT8_9PEZI|nr:hypothetical protein FN846DRAFT_1021732 [Sphaerosporella brunnea]
MPHTYLLSQLLSKHGQEEWGYVVYRITYDDEKLRLFLDALQAFVEYETDEEVVEMLHWIVMDDREAFDGASIAVVRKACAKATEACILADAASVDSVLAIALPGQPGHKFTDNREYVIVVDALHDPKVGYDPPSYPGWMKANAQHIGPLYNYILDEGVPTWYPGPGEPLQRPYVLPAWLNVPSATYGPALEQSGSGHFEDRLVT